MTITGLTVITIDKKMYCTACLRNAEIVNEPLWKEEHLKHHMSKTGKRPRHPWRG